VRERGAARRRLGGSPRPARFGWLPTSRRARKAPERETSQWSPPPPPESRPSAALRGYHDVPGLAPAVRRRGGVTPQAHFEVVRREDKTRAHRTATPLALADALLPAMRRVDPGRPLRHIQASRRSHCIRVAPVLQDWRVGSGRHLVRHYKRAGLHSRRSGGFSGCRIGRLRRLILRSPAPRFGIDAAWHAQPTITHHRRGGAVRRSRTDGSARVCSVVAVLVEGERGQKHVDAGRAINSRRAGLHRHRAVFSRATSAVGNGQAGAALRGGWPDK